MNECHSEQVLDYHKVHYEIYIRDIELDFHSQGELREKYKRLLIISRAYMAKWK